MIDSTTKKTGGRNAPRTRSDYKGTRTAGKPAGAYSRSRVRRNDDDEQPSRFRGKDDERKPRSPRRNDDKPFRASRSASAKPYGARSFRKDDDRDRKPYSRRGDDTDSNRKPRYRGNDDTDRKPRYPRNDVGDRKPSFRKTDDGDRKPRFRRDDDSNSKPTFRRSAATDRKPGFRKYGDSDNKPRFRRDDNSDRKPYSRRGDDAGSNRKPYSRRGDDAYGDAVFTKTRKIKDPDVDNLLGSDVRLNKFIANSGVCSRREADNYISAGVVTVNGAVVTEMGFKVNPEDDVRFNGERLKGEPKVYILLNKPKNFVTTTADPHADKTVMDLIGDKCPLRVFPVGRLDKNTTGVLLLTNDGALTEQLTHPSYNKKKIYDVVLHRKVKVADLRKLIEGVELEDGLAQADQIEYVGTDKTEVGLEIHSGRNRIVRRMFEALGYQIEKLDRVYFAGLTKKNLRRGEWRFLTESEISSLKMGAYE